MRARVLAVVAAAAAVLGNVVAGGGAAAADVCAAPAVSVADPRAQYEGSEGGTTTVKLTVTMAASTAGCPETGSVRYQTVDGTAEAGSDYVTAAGTLSWTGPGSQQVQLSVLRDDLKEQDEYFTLALFGPRGVTIADPATTVQVLDDDGSIPGTGLVVALPESGICWWPSDHCAIPVRLNTVARAPVSVRMRTVDGTAVAGKDYEPIKDRLVTIPKGADRVVVPVDLLAGAAPGEYFGVEISGATAGTIGWAHMKVTIQEG
ncbi:Calx-beta domain-containing protein [Actinophytocola sp. KF-1]